MIAKIFKTGFTMLLLVSLVAGGYAWWMWNRSDELLRLAILEHIATIAPEWEVELGPARFDLSGRVRLYDFSLRVKTHASPLIAIPEAVVTLDRNQFAQDQSITIQKIELRKPYIQLARDRDGHWNWQDLTLPEQTAQFLPELSVERGRIQLSLEGYDGIPLAPIVLQNVDIDAVPAGQDKFEVRGAMQLAEYSQVRLQGKWDRNEGSWELGGTLRDLTVGNELLHLATAVSPGLNEKLAGLTIPNLRPDSPSEWTGMQPVASTDPEMLSNIHPVALSKPASAPNLNLADLGLTATADVDFRVSQWHPLEPPAFEVSVNASRGQFVNPQLPFPLRNLNGQVLIDNHSVVVKNLVAQNGNTEVQIQGETFRQGEVSPYGFQIRLTDLPLDGRVRAMLPEAWLKTYDSLEPTGKVDIAFTLKSTGRTPLSVQLDQLSLKHCTLTHALFPYTVTDIVGTIIQQGETLLIQKLTGRAGAAPVTITGVVTNPGPAAEADFRILVEHLPIEDPLIAACPEMAAKAVTALNLQGWVDGRVQLTRAAGFDQPFQKQYELHFHDCQLAYENFRYELTKLSGIAKFVDDTWTFTDFRANHNGTVLAATGRFAMSGENKDVPGILDLSIDADGAQFDEQLEMALPDYLRTLYREYAPSGRFNLRQTRITWVPGQLPQIALPTIELVDASLLMSYFPYRWNNIQGTLSFKQDRLAISAVTARRDQTEVLITDGFVQLYPQNSIRESPLDRTPKCIWWVRLNTVDVKGLVADRSFQKALPTSLDDVMTSLNPQGPLTLSGMLEFKGWDPPELPMTAAWDVRVGLDGTSISPGVELTDVRGTLAVGGEWDGEFARLDGLVELQTITLWDHVLTDVRGPFHYEKDRLTIGAPAPPNTNPRAAQQRSTPISARAWGGRIDLEGAAVFTNDVAYGLAVTLTKARLEEYAKQHIKGNTAMRGVVNGSMQLSGRGSSESQVAGRGHVLISPAALYELPIIAQIFKVLRFIPPNKTAFNHARLDFQLENSRFLFEPERGGGIDLSGDAISLRGTGDVGFDGKLQLDFYSMLPRNQINIPFFTNFVGEATKGWVKVEVRGDTTNPKAAVGVAPEIGEKLKGLLRGLENGIGQPPPLLMPQPLSPPPIPGFPSSAARRGP